MNKANEHLRYPIGQYAQTKQKLTDDLKEQWIKAIESLPRWLEGCIDNIGEEGLDMPYRDGGWTIRQVVHHLADMHLQVYVWLKLALMEGNPTINALDEKVLACFIDATNAPITYSISILRGLHYRMAETLRNMKDKDWRRTYYHSEYNKEIVIWEMISFYAWHGSHHVAQIRHFYQNHYFKLRNKP